MTLNYTIYGLLLGCLHALSGPDHLLSLLPFIIGKRGYIAFGYGILWGLGHGISTSIMGILTYILKYTIISSSIWLERIIDIIVGITLIIIGLMGLIELKNNQQQNDIIEDKNINNVIKHDDNNNYNNNSLSRNFIQLSGILTNGIILGFQLDAIPSLSPAISINTTYILIIFILFYGIGTLLAISISSAIIGECSYLILNDILLLNSKLPLQLAYGSSICATILGLCWLFYAFYSYYNSINNIDINDGTTNISIDITYISNINLKYYTIIGIVMIIIIIYKRNFIHKFYSKYHSG